MSGFSVVANPSVMTGLEADTKLINDLIEWSGKNATTLAGEIGTAVTTITRPANGKATTRLGRKTLDALQAKFPDFPGWNAGKPAPPRMDRAPSHSTDADDAVEMVNVQHIDLAYGLGATFADSHVEIENMPFPKVWVETITHSPAELLTWARGRGDSMEPTIKDGDLVLLDRSQRVVREPDALWAYAVGSTAAIKRLRLKGDRLQVFSDNPSVPPDEEMLADVNIVGRVVFVGSRK